MITKIQSNEYLRRMDNMTAVERDEYKKRVGEWLESHAPLLMRKAEEDTARFLDAVQCSAGWNDAECKAWTEGAVLLTPLMSNGGTWLPDMLYVKAARRTIRRMADMLAMEYGAQGAAVTPAAEAPGATEAAAPFHGAGADGGGGGSRQDGEGRGEVAAVPARPRHIDQYVHLLPRKTQEKAATVKGLLRDLDVAREKMRLLMDDPGASGDSRAMWARTATSLDGKVKAIYKELDAEWEKLAASGRVAMDALGNVTVREGGNGGAEGASGDAGDGGKKPAEARKVALLRKFLIDTRNAKTDAQREKWLAKYREMVSIGGADAVTPRVRAAAGHYGIRLDDKALTETEGL